MEAMNCDPPEVQSRIGGIPDLVDDSKTEFLVPAGDVKTLAQRMQELVVNRELRKRAVHRLLVFKRVLSCLGSRMYTKA